MSASREKMEELVERLRGIEIEEELLLEMKRKLNEPPGIPGVNWRSTLEVFLEKCETVKEKEEHLCGEVFVQILSHISSENLINLHQLALLKALAHPKPEIQCRTMDELSERATREWEQVTSSLLSGGEAVLVGVSRLLESPDPHVSDKAARLLLLLSQDLRLTLSHPRLPNTLSAFLNSVSVTRFRFYEVRPNFSDPAPDWVEMIGNGCEKSEEFMNKAAELGWLAALVAELEKNDILVQLNALEILGSMAAGAPHCATFLHRANVSPRLNQMLLNCKTDPEGGFLFPAILKFFGYMAQERAEETCTLYPDFLASVWQSVFNWNELEMAQRLLAFDTLALLASTPAGRAFLAKHPGHMKKALQCLGEAASRGPSEVRERHYQALCVIFRAHPNQSTPEDTSMLEEWWSQVFPPVSTERIVTLFRQPLIGLHIASGDLIAAIAQHAWGVSQLIAVPGFVEYLLNRSTESEMNGRYTKYDIVGTIINSADHGVHIDAPVLLKLKEFYRQGPYFVKVNTEVAVESGE